VLSVGDRTGWGAGSGGGGRSEEQARDAKHSGDQGDEDAAVEQRDLGVEP
jgi:hypothetical protein